MSKTDKLTKKAQKPGKPAARREVSLALHELVEAWNGYKLARQRCSLA